MAIKKVEGGWLTDIQPGGRGQKRIRKKFRTRAEALAWENWARTQKNQAPEWQPQRKDTRKMSDLLRLWYEARGQELRSGRDTNERLSAAIQAMGDPLAAAFTPKVFTAYRAQRIEAGVSPATMNREHAYLRGMFNELSRLNLWKRENPLAKMRQVAVQETELTYLTTDQIFSMLKSLAQSHNPHVVLVSKICLSIGARWSEAENLRMSQVRNARITLARTKNGKVRTIPISPELQQEIEQHAQKHPQQMNNSIFAPCYSAFREGIKRAGINLPPGQLTHVLRHTFASHFMMNGGNILALQRILGHTDLKTTMRYAHLAPDHLESARALNPLNYSAVDTSLTDGTETKDKKKEPAT